MKYLLRQSDYNCQLLAARHQNFSGAYICCSTWPGLCKKSFEARDEPRAQYIQVYDSFILLVMEATARGDGSLQQSVQLVATQVRTAKETA